MDAKVLRAAVSAAIRLTVSTTLIGCGGNVSTDAERAASSADAKDPPASADEPESASTGGGGGTNAAATKPKPSTGGAFGVDPMTANAGGQGPDVGGMTSTAGAGGELGGAGAPATSCQSGEVCLASLERTTPTMPTSAATKACCETVLASLELLQQSQQPGDAECYDGLFMRFLEPSVRNQCCSDPETWTQSLACTPWGPPVPPELPLDALLEWSLAA